MRRFGIEIESGLLRGHVLRDVSAALRDAGLGGSSHGYSGHSMTEWVVKTDGSVPNGVEVVSPPLDFDDPSQRGQVRTAIEAMKLHCQPVESAGIHVHIESRDLTPRQLSGVARTWTHFEDVIYRIASSGWRTIRRGAHSYARPLHESQVDGLAKAKTEVAVKRAYYGPDYAMHGGHGDGARYCVLNLHSHFYRGTIEFRAFNTSLNPKRVNVYIAVCMAVVEDARRGHLRSVKKGARLGAMATGSADGAKLFFRFLSVFRYEVDMSLDDYRDLKSIWKDSRAQQAIPSYNPRGVW